MIELGILAFVGIAFAKAGKGNNNSSKLGLLGVVYYLIGKLFFIAVLYIGYITLTDETEWISIIMGFSMSEWAFSSFFALIAAYTFGLMSGLDIAKAMIGDLW